MHQALDRTHTNKLVHQALKSLRRRGNRSDKKQPTPSGPGAKEEPNVNLMDFGKKVALAALFARSLALVLSLSRSCVHVARPRWGACEQALAARWWEGSNVCVVCA